MKPVTLRLFGFVALGAALAVAGQAQTTGQIEGVVRDSAGGALPGVSVVATSPSLQGQRTFVTDQDGRFRFPAVPPGLYRVTATLPSFHTAAESATVTLDGTATVGLTLHPEVQEQVAVTGAAPLIDEASTTTGTTYTAQVVAQLPVERNYADIVRANPGVVSDKGVTQGRSLALSIYGSTSAENQWIIDGVNTTNVLKGIQGKAINNEFVEEVQVKSGGYQAEYGRALGGIVNVITKSGGNEFHGDAFYYYDSIDTQAERIFEPGVDSDLTGMRLADYTRHDYGADLGGYLLKDRLWFFAAYNRVEFPAKVSRYVSSELVPNTMEFPLEGTDNLYSGKLTWNIAASSTLVGSVFGDPTTNSGAGKADPRQGGFIVQNITNPDPGTWESSRSIGALDLGLRLNQLFGASALLTVQGALHQERYELVPTGPGLQVRLEDFTCKGAPDEPCPPFEPNFVEGGLGLIEGQDNHSESDRAQVRADAAMYWGDHEVKVGGDYQNGRTAGLTFYSGGQRVRRFDDIGQVYYRHSFITASFADLVPVDKPINSAVRDFGAYVQDSWRIRPNLTLNAGLRYDREWVLNYADEAVFTTNEWQPRLGVVWDPTGDGTSKVYAFAGRFSYGLPTDLAIRVFGADFGAVTYNFDPVSVEPDDVPEHESFFFGGPFGMPVDAGLKNYSQDELTVGVEKLLNPSWTLGLKGTYRSLHNAMEDRCDFDYTSADTDYSNCWLINPGSDAKFAQGDAPTCTRLDEFDNCFDGTPSTVTGPPSPPVRRIYRGIEVMARKTVSNRLWLQASYVFSSLMGNYDGAVGQNILGQTEPGINADFDYPQMWHNGYGRLYLDRPHQGRLDVAYVMPFGLSLGLQTWVRSGAPLNRYGYFNGNYGSVILLDPKGSSGKMPAEWDANLTLSYPIRLGPATVTLQGYLFNVFNNQIRTDQDMTWVAARPEDYPDSLYDPNQQQKNPNYGLIVTRADPRLFRAAVKISF